MQPQGPQAAAQGQQNFRTFSPPPIRSRTPPPQFFGGNTGQNFPPPATVIAQNTRVFTNQTPTNNQRPVPPTSLAHRAISPSPLVQRDWETPPNLKSKPEAGFSGGKAELSKSTSSFRPSEPSSGGDQHYRTPDERYHSPFARSISPSFSSMKGNAEAINSQFAAQIRSLRDREKDTPPFKSGPQLDRGNYGNSGVGRSGVGHDSLSTAPLTEEHLGFWNSGQNDKGRHSPRFPYGPGVVFLCRCQ